ncbi:unnamed protein product [Closterium sp. NIES-65]|nr:unnamed protein product [Closterium sp. NIES-65]
MPYLPRPLDAAGSPPRALAGGFPAAASAARSRSSRCRIVPPRRRSIAVTWISSSAAVASSASASPFLSSSPSSSPASLWPGSSSTAASRSRRTVPAAAAPSGPVRDHASLRSALVASAQFALLILPSWPPPSAPELAPPPRARPFVPAHQQSQPTPAPPVVNEDEVFGTPRDPDVDWWGVLWPHVPREGNWGTPPPSPPWGEPRPGDGAYQSRVMRLSEVGRCVTELSFVLDLLHYALQSQEVVARDPQLSEDQQRRVRRAVSNALWDVLHLPLEPEDPLLDDGPGSAAFRMVATAAEESPPGIVPAFACVLRWLGRRVERM